MSGYQWLLMLHVTGAFFLLGGSIDRGAPARSSPCAPTGRARSPCSSASSAFALPVLLLGSLMTLVLGLWLVHHVGYSYGTFWVWGAIVLWVVANALGKIGGEKQEQARKLADAARRRGRRARAPSCARCCATRVSNAMSWAAGAGDLRRSSS